MLMLPCNGLLSMQTNGPLVKHFDFGTMDKLCTKKKSVIIREHKTLHKSLCQMTRILAEQGRGYLARKLVKTLQVPPQE
jgi:predicted butyrate kinase (DUF1464 family)